MTTKNRRKYTEQELVAGARSLAWRPLNINHNESALLPYPENTTLEADYDKVKKGVVGRMRIADETINLMIESGRINRLSVEQLPVKGESCDSVACEQHGVTFVGLALLTSDTTPGDSSTRIVAEAESKKQERVMVPFAEIVTEAVATTTTSANEGAAHVYAATATRSGGSSGGSGGGGGIGGWFKSAFKGSDDSDSGDKDDGDCKWITTPNGAHVCVPESFSEAVKALPEKERTAMLEAAAKQFAGTKYVKIPEVKASTDTSLKHGECGCNQRMSAEVDNSKKIDEVNTASAPAPAAAPATVSTPAPSTPATVAPTAPAAASVTSVAPAPVATPTPTASAASASSTPAPVVNIDMTPVASAITEGFKNHQQVMLEQLQKQLGIAKKQESAAVPSSRVDDSLAKAKIESYNKMKEWFVGAAKRTNVGPQHEWTVSKDEIMRRYTGVGYDGKVASTREPTFKQIESITVTGGDMPQFFSNQLQQVPGGRMPLNIRPYCNFVDLDGQDRANWYKMDGTTVYTITEGTEPTQSAQTVTKITATPAIRGVYNRVGYSQVENAPFDLVQGVQDHMSLSLIDDEATDLLTTVYDAISPTNWVNGSSGAAITSDDVASMTFNRDALLAAKQLISQQGHDVRPGNLVLFMHPKAYTELLLDTDLNNYYQYATPDITARGVLEMIYGCELVVTDAVKAKDNATNDTYRNVLAVKQKAFGLASARDITFEAQKRNELQQILITATQRVKSAVIDETATCRISSAQ